MGKPRIRFIFFPLFALPQVAGLMQLLPGGLTGKCVNIQGHLMYENDR